MALQGPSPDEVALVEGGRLLGFEFVGRSRNSLTVRIAGHEARFLMHTCVILSHHILTEMVTDTPMKI